MIQIVAENFLKEESLDIVAPLYAEMIEATNREPGCMYYNLFVDQADQTHYVFVEQWKDQESLDAHFASEHFQRLIPQIAEHAKQEKRVLRMNPFAQE